ncbi:MAG TPA: hypothetical protein PKC69_05375 [Chitinophagaceae bacterium]|nr:hypothetical protein [Chitinophagaceae bacterium]
MKKMYKVFLGILAAVMIVAVVFGLYLSYYLPDAGKASSISIERTPQRIERGRYLAHHVAVCMDCRSTRDWSRFAGPLAGSLYTI